MCPKLDITRTKPNPFKVAHSEGDFMNHAERAENWREAGTIMPAGVHPVHLTPPHPARFRKRL